MRAIPQRNAYVMDSLLQSVASGGTALAIDAPGVVQARPGVVAVGEEDLVRRRGDAGV